MRYLLVIERGSHNLSAYFPDVLGCIATGGSVEEVERMAAGALELHLRDEDVLPEARSLEAHLAEGLELGEDDLVTWVAYEPKAHAAA